MLPVDDLRNAIERIQCLSKPAKSEPWCALMTIDSSVAAALLRRQAGELLSLADEVDGGSSTQMPAPGRRRWIELAHACKITGKSSSWVYRVAREHGLGWKLDTGSWVFDEEKLRKFMSWRSPRDVEKSEICEVSDASSLSKPSPRRVVRIEESRK